MSSITNQSTKVSEGRTKSAPPNAESSSRFFKSGCRPDKGLQSLSKEAGDTPRVGKQDQTPGGSVRNDNKIKRLNPGLDWKLGDQPAGPPQPNDARVLDPAAPSCPTPFEATRPAAASDTRRYATDTVQRSSKTVTKCAGTITTTGTPRSTASLGCSSSSSIDVVSRPVLDAFLRTRLHRPRHPGRRIRTETERVPVTLNIAYAAALPLATIVLTNLVARAPRHKHHVSVLGLAIALVLTSFLTDTVKNSVGRPRPDLVARCKPARGTPENKLVGVEVCTEARHHVLHDGWRSFPSGHSSFSFAGLGYLSLFLAGQVRLFVVGTGGGGGKDGGGRRRRKTTTTTTSPGDDSDDGNKAVFYARGDLARALLCLAPLLGAAMIAISRCQDYRHDVYDVCTGALLGYVVAHWSYRRYWPRLGSRRCHEPYPDPGGDDDGLVGGGRLPLYGRLRDEEEGGGVGVDAGGGGNNPS